MPHSIQGDPRNTGRGPAGRRLVNDPRRTQDLEDIRASLRANVDELDMIELRGYFRLFDREALLDEIITGLK